MGIRGSLLRRFSAVRSRPVRSFSTSTTTCDSPASFAHSCGFVTLAGALTPKARSERLFVSHRPAGGSTMRVADTP